MKMHRANARPEWAATAKRYRNAWQQLAAVSRGVLTLANVLTLTGLGLVLYGLVEVAREQYAVAFWTLLVGRLLDIADGWAANATGTKSPLGEALDAGVDKLEIAAALVVLGATSVVPLWAIAMLAVPHVCTALVFVAKRAQAQHLHPSGLGKISTALAWLGVGGFVALKTFDIEGNAAFLTLTYVLTTCSLVVGLTATWRYATGRSRQK